LERTERDRLLHEAIDLYQRGDWPEAMRLCNALSDDIFDDHRAAYLIGLCCYRMQDPAMGRSIIAATIERHPALRSFDFLRFRPARSSGNSEIDVHEQRFLRMAKHEATSGFVISYPKCGRTWLRLMLGCYALGTTQGDDPLEVYEITAKLQDVPTVDVTHDDYPHLRPLSQMFQDKRAYAGKAVVLLARDPRDVLVSNFFQYTRRGDDRLAGKAFRGDLSAFIRQDSGGVASLVAFYNLWARNRGLPRRFLLLSYEDLVADTRKHLLDCAGLFEWPQRAPALVGRIVGFASFANMRLMEERRTIDSVRLQGPPDGDPEGYKVRRGKVGGYRDYMTPADIGFVNDYLSQHLDDLYARYKPAS
jgi:hypothetical protein